VCGTLFHLHYCPAQTFYFWYPFAGHRVLHFSVLHSAYLLVSCSELLENLGKAFKLTYAKTLKYNTTSDGIGGAEDVHHNFYQCFERSCRGTLWTRVEGIRTPAAELRVYPTVKCGNCLHFPNLHLKYLGGTAGNNFLLVPFDVLTALGWTYL
jgi:hypothetical protein